MKNIKLDHLLITIIVLCAASLAGAVVLPGTELLSNAGRIQGKKVPAPTAADHGRILVFDNDSGSYKWKNQSANGGSTSISSSSPTSFSSGTILASTGTLLRAALIGDLVALTDSTHRFTTDAEKASWDAKQPAGSYLIGNQTITVSGDASGTGTTSIVLTLSALGTPGTYAYPASVTIDSKGRVSAITAGVAPATISCSAGYHVSAYNAGTGSFTCTQDATSGGTTDSNALHVNVSGEIAGITLKASPASGDLLVIEDSAAANAKKRVTLDSIFGLGSTATKNFLASRPKTTATDILSVLGTIPFANMSGANGLQGKYQPKSANLTTFAAIAPSANVVSLLGAADYAAFKTLLGLTIGTNVQAYSSVLTTYAGVTPSANAQTLLGHTFSQMMTDLGAAPLNSPTLVTPNIGAATGTSLLATGIIDGKVNVDLLTGTTATLGGAGKLNSYSFNNYATNGTAVTYTLPTAAAGIQHCVKNYTAKTGTIRVNTSAAGQYIDMDGTNSASGGYVISGGALGDGACFIGVDTTHWVMFTVKGTWTLN